MAVTRVYRFRYLDRQSGRMILADDWATTQAIAHIGGVIEPGSEKEVEDAEISTTAGLVIRPSQA